MPFRFPLASVLLVRENAEKREERKLQKIQFEMARIIQQVEEVSAEIANTFTAREQAMRQPIPAIQLHSFQRQAQVSAEKKTRMLQRLQTLEQERAQQLVAYQAAHRDHEMLLDLMNHQRAVYDQEQSRTQQKRLDDLFIARRFRS